MIKQRIRTGNEPQTVVITIVAKEPCTLKIVAGDALHKNSIYHRINKGGHNISFQGRKAFDIKLPIAPKLLNVGIWCGDDSNVEIPLVQHKALNEDPILKSLNKDMVEFIQFAAKFCKEAGYIRSGQIIRSKTDRFVIKYMPYIEDEHGNHLETPARIRRSDGEIEINAEVFRTYSIPVRMYILLHEISHYFHNTRNEFAADDSATLLYEQLGFPRNEAVYAFSKVFDDMNSEQDERTKRVLHRMKEFKVKEDRQYIYGNW